MFVPSIFPRLKPCVFRVAHWGQRFHSCPTLISITPRFEFLRLFCFSASAAVAPQLSIAFRMFDRDDSGAVDNREFDSFMKVLRGETNVGRTEGTRSQKKYYGGEENIYKTNKQANKQIHTKIT